MVKVATGLKGIAYLMRFITMFAALVTALVLVPAFSAFAHSPIYPDDNHDLSHAYVITNPAKSWAFFTALGRPDKGDYYKFTVSKGDRIQIGLMASASPSVSGFLPSAALMIPGSERRDNLPSHLEVPPGYGTIVVNGEDPGKASYEPFSPAWFYELAELTIDAPADGTYYLVVYDKVHKTGNYALAFGYIESFTLAEWLMIPFSVHKTYVWEGQNLYVTHLPLVLTITIGGLLLYRRRNRNKAPKGLSKWLAAFAGLAFVGTSAGILYQMILATSVTGLVVEFVFTLIFVAIGVVLGTLALRYAIREKPKLTMGRRISLILIGIFALVGWSGLFIGTLLVILAAAAPPYTGSK